MSRGVISDVSYGIPEGLIFSVPLKIGSDGNWSVVQGLEINDFARSMLDTTTKVRCQIYRFLPVVRLRKLLVMLSVVSK